MMLPSPKQKQPITVEYEREPLLGQKRLHAAIGDETSEVCVPSEFTNCLFLVLTYERRHDFTCLMSLKLLPPIDRAGYPILTGFVECPTKFSVLVSGIWAKMLWVTPND
jgi:hypothetical protein